MGEAREGSNGAHREDADKRKGIGKSRICDTSGRIKGKRRLTRRDDGANVK